MYLHYLVKLKCSSHTFYHRVVTHAKKLQNVSFLNCGLQIRQETTYKFHQNRPSSIEDITENIFSGHSVGAYIQEPYGNFFLPLSN